MQVIEIKGGELKDKSRKQPMSSSHKSSSKGKSSISDSQAVKILEQIERLLGNGETLECINLLRALKDNMQGVKNANLHILIIINLGILYYQAGFLEQAHQQFSAVIHRLREMSQKLIGSRSKDILRIKYQTTLAKLELQLCILYSQLGKHELALEHAMISSKINYNLIYDILSRLYGSLNKLLITRNYQKQEELYISLKEGGKLLNSIAVLNHLLNSTKDLKLAFVQKERVNILEQQTQTTRKYGYVSPKIDIEQLYNPQERADYLWIYKNKILDEIQLMPLDVNEFEDLQSQVTNNQVIQKVTYLAISLYCYSTETRFIEKQKNCDSHDVLDSEHWLSRSLEIAYSFMPAEAPILNQIITVHDRFHGLDKQTIPQDQEVTGFFKVLKPLSKPKSTYSSKSPGCSPIMIRIQADKVDVQMESTVKTRIDTDKKTIESDQKNKTLELEIITKNNKIRNYSHGHKRIETADGEIEKPWLSARSTIDCPQTHNPNIRTNYASKKFGRKEDKLKLNFSQLNGKAIISEDLLSRPRSIEQPLSKSTNNEGTYRFFSEKKKKSLPGRKMDIPKKSNFLGNSIKFQGLELKGHQVEETIEPDFLERINNESKAMGTARLGGNVYINNNISLFISPNENVFAQTFVRGQVATDRRREEREKELSRRQIFLSKRRGSHFISPSDL